MRAIRAVAVVAVVITASLAAASGASGLVAPQATSELNGNRAGASVTPAGGFVPSGPTRVLDTRVGLGAPKAAVAPGHTVAVQVSGAAGVPANAGGVALNVTVTSPARAGYLTVFPSPLERPHTSTLNFAAGETVANMTLDPFGVGDGRMDFYNGSAGTVHVIADVAGYFVDGDTSDPGTIGWSGTTRIMDTRDGTGVRKGAVPSAGTVTLQVGGGPGVPDTGISAVIMNVTATGSSRSGYVTAYPTGAARPSTSNLNYAAGATRANLVTVETASSGQVTFYNGSAGPVQLLADILGFYRSGSPSGSGLFVPLSPARILDTRNGTGGVTGPVGSAHTIGIATLGNGGLPASGVGALVGNITAVAETHSGYATLYPSDTARPSTSSLNFGAGVVTANHTIVRVPASGVLDLYNGSAGSTHFLLDVAGYFTQ